MLEKKFHWACLLKRFLRTVEVRIPKHVFHHSQWHTCFAWGLSPGRQFPSLSSQCGLAGSIGYFTSILLKLLSLDLLQPRIWAYMKEFRKWNKIKTGKDCMLGIIFIDINSGDIYHLRDWVIKHQVASAVNKVLCK